MALDINAIRGRLNKLQNSQKKSDMLWKPSVGSQQVRIVPYKFDEENPFIELLFHYNINNKTYLSPQSFGRPDPIVEFAQKLKNMGDKDDWKAARKMEPKLRTFVPVIVRGEEEKGVKFWGFGKTVYQELLGYIADPDYGDIADIANGRDITVEYVSAEAGGTQFPVTNIRIKPNQTPLVQDPAKSQELIDKQTAITDMYSELSYDELKAVLEGWLNPDAEKVEAPKAVSQSIAPAQPTQPVVTQTETVTQAAPTPVVETAAPIQATKGGNVEKAFDDLFNS